MAQKLMASLAMSFLWGEAAGRNMAQETPTWGGCSCIALISVCGYGMQIEQRRPLYKGEFICPQVFLHPCIMEGGFFMFKSKTPVYPPFLLNIFLALRNASLCIRHSIAFLVTTKSLSVDLKAFALCFCRGGFHFQLCGFPTGQIQLTEKWPESVCPFFLGIISVCSLRAAT